MKVKGFRDLPDPVVTDDVKKMFRRSKRKKTDYFFITAIQKNLNSERMLVLDVFIRVDGEIKPMLRCFFGKEEYMTWQVNYMFEKKLKSPNDIPEIEKELKQHELINEREKLFIMEGKKNEGH